MYKKASTLNKLILEGTKVFYAFFSSMILFVSVITTSKMNIFKIFLIYDL